MTHSFSEYKKVTREHLTKLQDALAKEKTEREKLEGLVDLAGRQLRQVTVDRDVLKRRALRAEAELKSAGGRIEG